MNMGQNANGFDFLLGEWEIAMLVMPEGTTVGRRATSQVRRILDGTALLDEIRHLDEAGQVNFRGASFRTFVPDSGRPICGPRRYDRDPRGHRTEMLLIEGGAPMAPAV
jgi:hypothetical protein